MNIHNFCLKLFDKSCVEKEIQVKKVKMNNNTIVVFRRTIDGAEVAPNASSVQALQERFESIGHVQSTYSRPVYIRFLDAASVNNALLEPIINFRGEELHVRR